MLISYFVSQVLYVHRVNNVMLPFKVFSVLEVYFAVFAIEALRIISFCYHPTCSSYCHIFILFGSVQPHKLFVGVNKFIDNIFLNFVAKQMCNMLYSDSTMLSNLTLNITDLSNNFKALSCLSDKTIGPVS